VVNESPQDQSKLEGLPTFLRERKRACVNGEVLHLGADERERRERDGDQVCTHLDQSRGSRGDGADRWCARRINDYVATMPKPRRMVPVKKKRDARDRVERIEDACLEIAKGRLR
jgi:hypothetical protein